jgi:hypothetical protein
MADTVKQGSAPDGPQEPGPAPATVPDHPGHAARGEDPPTGGLTAVLGKLRDAASAHDDELSDPGSPPQPS